MKNPVGRPKTLDRKKLINIAFEEYWLKGFNNVTLSSIANIAKISRPGIYKEFKDEDGLKCEALKKYTNALKNNVTKQYIKSNDIRTLICHFYSTIGIPQNKKYFRGIRHASSINIPKGSKGCFYEKAKIVKYLLSEKTVNEINDFEQHRKNEFIIYIKKMQNNGKITKSFKSDVIYEYISATLSMAQNLELNEMNKFKIKSIVDKALSCILSQKIILN
ncbi:MAG: hypothetical protein CFH33_01416 [Alphaproteobacteria bacterium MarineAlpha9_Bin3]|nr:MAG: hypothetical protein CFH33_01416 [Alphaproteobacteria bacterium MarineAlpha9_Bin3]|tara:strand:- start:8201 stop:8857 length:657 start_codon:yes stop_codon:yes gene_type:complete